METEVGDYIRLIDGRLRKCTEIDIYYGDILIRNREKDIIYDFEIIKKSKNIIDLIEVRGLCEWA